MIFSFWPPFHVRARIVTPRFRARPWKVKEDRWSYRLYWQILYYLEEDTLGLVTVLTCYCLLCWLAVGENADGVSFQDHPGDRVLTKPMADSDDFSWADLFGEVNKLTFTLLGLAKIFSKGRSQNRRIGDAETQENGLPGKAGASTGNFVLLSPPASPTLQVVRKVKQRSRNKKRRSKSR